MELEDLIQATKNYREIEGRVRFYDIALEIVENHPLQASIILLATWNISRFRFMTSDPKNLHDLIRVIIDTKPLFQKLKVFKLQTADLDSIEDLIKEIYSKLSQVKGVEYTGASKVMHLINTRLFVMWDGHIRKKYRVKTTKEDYFKFLKLIQNEIKDISWQNKEKTLAKAIDEYNYVNYTFPNLKKV